MERQEPEPGAAEPRARTGVPGARRPHEQPAGAATPAEPGPVTGPGSEAGLAGPSEPAGPGRSAPAGERAELERLRAEVGQLRARVDADETAPPPARGRWRTPAAVVAIAAGCILAPVSVIGVWGASQVSNTDRYVANMEPLIHDPAIQHALSGKLTDQVTRRVDVKALVTQASDQLVADRLPRLSSLLNNFAGPIDSAVDNLVSTTVARVVASPAAAAFWVQANRTAHSGIVSVLSGQGNGNLTVFDGKVALNLGPLIAQVKQQLVARGLTVAAKIPAVNATFPLFEAKNLSQAQSGYRLLTTLRWVLPLLSLPLLVAGVLISRRRRRGLLGAALGVAASMLVLTIGLAIARAIYLNSVPQDVLPSDAAAAAFDTLVRFVKDALRVLLLVGLVVAAGAFLAGPSGAAVSIRHGVTGGIGWLRERGGQAGLRTGPAGAWTAAHIRILRIAAVLVAVIVFVFWGQPTLGVVVWLLVALLVVLGIIELLGGGPRKAGPAEAGPAQATVPAGADPPGGT